MLQARSEVTPRGIDDFPRADRRGPWSIVEQINYRQIRRHCDSRQVRVLRALAGAGGRKVPWRPLLACGSGAMLIRGGRPRPRRFRAPALSWIGSRTGRAQGGAGSRPRQGRRHARASRRGPRRVAENGHPSTAGGSDQTVGPPPGRPALCADDDPVGSVRWPSRRTGSRQAGNLFLQKAPEISEFEEGFAAVIRRRPVGPVGARPSEVPPPRTGSPLERAGRPPMYATPRLRTRATKFTRTRKHQFWTKETRKLRENVDMSGLRSSLDMGTPSSSGRDRIDALWFATYRPSPK